MCANLRAVRQRARDQGWDTCFVVTDDRVVLGRLGRHALALDDESTVEDAMSEGPSTVRPSIGIDALIKRMDERDLTTLPLTTSEGRLVGLVRRADAEKAVASVLPSA